MVRVLITDDSPVVSEILRKILSSDPEIEVVGWARNGRESTDLAYKLRPDVITMDINMPVLDGLQATRAIMEKCPTPIIVISSSVSKEDTRMSFDLINAGALDVMEKPRAESPQSYSGMASELIRRVKIVSRVRPFRRTSAQVRTLVQPVPMPLSKVEENRILAFGASTGGPQALLSILKGLPANISVPMIAVQHISPGFTSGLVDWLNHECSVEVVVAKDGERLRPGVIYFPEDDCHLSIGTNGELRQGRSLPVGGHRPSIDYMMRTVAASYGPNAVGILLTGMGRDGVDGMKAIKAVGGTTFAQDEASSVIFGMPREAIAAGVVDRVVAVDDLAFEILTMLAIN